MKNRNWIFMLLAIVLMLIGIAVVLQSKSNSIAQSEQDQTISRLEYTNTPKNMVTETIQIPSTFTPTILPTLSEFEKQEILTDLVKTNGGCEYPCVWGINIGKTNFYEAAENLIPFAIPGRYGYTESDYFGAALKNPKDDNKTMYISFMRGEDDNVFCYSLFG